MFGLPLWWSLETQIPYRVEQQFVDSPEEGSLIAVQLPELSYLRTPDGEATYKRRLLVRGLPDLLRHSEIRLLVADYGKPRRVRAAQISVPAGNCAYDATPGERLPNNDVLLFARRQPCLPVSTTSPQDVVLTIRLSEPGPIALWTAAPRVDRIARIQLLWVTSIDGQEKERAVIGTFGQTDYSRTASRLQLLNYVWQVSQSAWWLVALITLSLIHI